MFVVCVTVHVIPEFKDAFIEATKHNYENTRQELGNLRFDVLQAKDDQNQFFLYEVYREEKGFLNHKETVHYKKWRTTVAEMMAKDRAGVKYYSLLPEKVDSFES